ncbi:genetic competence negative regulator [Alkalibacillus haloalkaliphilus]|uniref:genetic competence negative regulator n=1 Tax=Alkalibacillus haloalkaliphilus TaxID=94136 RepID=UPI0002DD4D3F|nr:genetic competence negative regulator [Alkalibacillus haloalkaliphilus]
MRLERISVNQFKIFLTYDDLNDRGYSKEDLWNNLPKANQLFQDMLYEASEELEMDLDGMLVVRVHMLQAQGMIIVVTQNEGETDDEYIELKVTMDESKEIMFSFDSIEPIIQLSRTLQNQDVEASVYQYDQRYYMKVFDQRLLSKKREDLISIMSEFGAPSTVTSYVLEEYGVEIVKNNAIEVMNKYFK